MNARTFSAHDTHRLRSLDGVPLASFRSRALAFALDLVLFNVVAAAGSFAWTTMHPPAAGSEKVLFVNLHTW